MSKLYIYKKIEIIYTLKNTIRWCYQSAPKAKATGVASPAGTIKTATRATMKTRRILSLSYTKAGFTLNLNLLIVSVHTKLTWF
jgi:hypothetical protein